VVRRVRWAGRLLVVGVITIPLLPAPAAATTRTNSILHASSAVEREPSPGDLARQQAKEAALQATARSQAADVKNAQRALSASAVMAGQALEDYSVAVRALQVAQADEQRRTAVMDSTSTALQSSRRALGRWARQAYQGGSSLAADPTLNTLLQTPDGQDLPVNQAILRRLGVITNRSIGQARTAQLTADRAEDAAADATNAAASAAVAAANAKQASDRAVTQERQLLGAAEANLSRTQQSVKDAAKQRATLAAAARISAEQHAAGSPSSAGQVNNRTTGQVGSCAGGNVGQYPNGEIPLAVLCPLSSAPGQYLRADAAYAFDRLSYAYAQEFGADVCVTDSYRSYPTQVTLYAQKPNLAAVPGTSNHGWGTAVDLCGGIQSFGTAQHLWMLDNAPLYGWFHPGWAQQTGSRPEPWHWEFSG
jgi:LAS superfamily LD-carboxypeptidase LdcB